MVFTAVEAKRWLKQHRSALSAPQATLANVCAALAEPLIQFGLDSTQSPSVTLQDQIIIIEAAFPEHTRFLLAQVGRNWLEALTREQIRQYVDTYFLPSFWSDNLLAGYITANSLRVLMDALTETGIMKETPVRRLTLRLLCELLEQLDIGQLYTACTHSETGQSNWRDIVSLLVSLPTRVANALPDMTIPAILQSTEYYVLLAKHLANLFDRGNVNAEEVMLFERCLRQGYGNYMATVLAQRYADILDKTQQSYWQHAIVQLSTLQQERLLALLLKDAQIPSYNKLDWFNMLLFHNKSSDAMHTAIERCLRVLQGLVLDLGLWYQLIQQIDHHLSHISTSDKHYEYILHTLLKQWGDVYFIQHTDTQQQLYKTQILLLLIHVWPINILKEVTHHHLLLDGMSNRLKSKDTFIRQMAMVVGESLSARTEPKERQLDFHLDAQDSQVILLRSTVTQAEQSIAQQQATPHPSTQDTISQGENADNTDHHDVDEDDPDALVGNIDDLSSEEEESVKERKDDSESDDEVDFPSRALQTKPPRYLRDVLEYLSSDEDARKYQLGLDSAANIISQLSSSDIEPLAIDVARKLVRLQDTYDMPQFNEKLTKALIELMVKNETATSYIIQQLSDRNYGLARRILVLECLERTAVALSESSTTSTTQSPTQSTPHLGKVVWRSERLKQANAVSKSGTAWQRRYQRILYPLFAQLQVKSPDSFSILGEPMVLSKYLATASHMIQLSEHVPDIWSITSQYLDLLLALRHYPHVDVIEGVLAGYLTVITTLNPKVHIELLEHAPSLQTWLTDVLSRQDTVYTMATAVAMALQAFISEAQKSLQMNE